MRLVLLDLQAGDGRPTFLERLAGAPAPPGSS
jgi:hypothetical protein